MKKIFALTKRNCLLFVRSKATVFFSLFSSLILIALYFLFIAKLYSDGFNQASGLELNSNQLNFAIYSQMIMGVLVINSVSLSTGMLGFMATDFETRKTDAFMMTKLRPFELSLSYLLSTLIVSFLFNFLTLVVSVIVIGISTTYWLSFATFCAIFGALVVTTIVSCALMLLITSLIKSSNAMGVLNGILGTILGFLCGIYMPYSNMGAGAKTIGSLLPFTHLTVWMKQIALNDVFGQFGMSADLSAKMQDLWFSAGNVGLAGLNVPLWANLLLCGVFALICLAISVFILRKRLFTKNKISKISKKSLKNAK